MKKYTILLLLTFYYTVVCAQNNAENIIVNKIPFKLFNNHIYLNVRINHSKPLWFLLDTGSGDIIDLKNAKDLNLALSDFQKTFGSGDASDDVAITKNVSFQIQGTNFTEKKIAVVALKSVEECANKLVVDTTGKITMQQNAIENKDQYQPMDGVLGSYFFNKFVIEINFKQQLLTLYDPIKYHYHGSGTIIPIEITGNNIFTYASIKLSGTENINGRFMIDTGLMAALILNTPFITTNNLLPPSSQTTPLNVCGIGGSSKALVGTVQSLRLQQIDINKPPTIFSQATNGVLSSTEFDGIIGNAILRHFKVIFDYYHKQIILE